MPCSPRDAAARLPGAASPVSDEDDALRRFQSSSLQRRAIDFGQWIHDTGFARTRLRGHDGIRPRHGRIFVHLGWNGSRLTDIAIASDVTKNAIGRLADELEELGYVERTPDPRDGRTKILRYTDRGRQFLGDAKAVGDEVRRELADLIGEDRVRLLHEILDEIAAKQPRRLPGPDTAPRART